MSIEQRGIAAVCLVIALIWLSCSVYGAQMPQIPDEYKVPTMAMITDITTEFLNTFSERGQDTRKHATVCYEVDGKRYERRLGTYHTGMGVGKTIGIYYDIRDPNCIEVQDAQIAQIVSVAFILALALGFMALGIILLRKPSSFFCR